VRHGEQASGANGDAPLAEVGSAALGHWYRAEGRASLPFTSAIPADNADRRALAQAPDRAHTPPGDIESPSIDSAPSMRTGAS
jgi:hypothetical protein